MKKEIIANLAAQENSITINNVWKWDVSLRDEGRNAEAFIEQLVPPLLIIFGVFKLLAVQTCSNGRI